MLRLIATIALVVCAAFFGANAQTFPSRQINLIVPFPPGAKRDGWREG